MSHSRVLQAFPGRLLHQRGGVSMDKRKTKVRNVKVLIEKVRSSQVKPLGPGLDSYPCDDCSIGCSGDPLLHNSVLSYLWVQWSW